MYLNLDEVSLASEALKAYGESLVGNISDESMATRRKIWVLRDKIHAWYESQPSSAENEPHSRLHVFKGENCKFCLKNARCVGRDELCPILS